MEFSIRQVRSRSRKLRGILFSQKVFIALTGNKNDAAIVITTLIVGAAFAPIRTRLQGFIDQQFTGLSERTKGLQAFGQQVHSFAEMHNPGHLTARLLSESAKSMHAQSGAIAVVNGDQSAFNVRHTYQQWKGEVIVNLPVKYKGSTYGFLMLGERADGQSYTRQEYRILEQVTHQIAEAIHLSYDQSGIQTNEK